VTLNDPPSLPVCILPVLDLKRADIEDEKIRAFDLVQSFFGYMSLSRG
jgi:hypothetical protein